MKQILGTFLVFIMTTVSVFAATNIDVSTQKQDYNIDENIILNIEVATDNSQLGEIQITGLENFNIIGNSQGQSSSIINEKSSSTFILQLTLIAKQAGDYIIGPIVVYDNEEEIKSETSTLHITGERIMVNPHIQVNEEEDGETEQNLDEIHLGKQTKNTEEHIIGIDGEAMEDIYPIRENIKQKFISLWSILFTILVGIIIFFIDKKYFGEKNLIKKIKPKKKINYQKELRQIEKKYLSAKKEVFYAHIGELLRMYLDENIQEGLSSQSLKELEKNLYFQSNTGKKIIHLYKSIYFPEYDMLENNIEEREKNIKELYSLFKK